MSCKLVEIGTAYEIWQKKTKEKLKQTKSYLRIEFKTYVVLQDRCADHFLSYAISDVKNPKTCGSYYSEHNHDCVLDRFQNLQSTLNDIKPVLELVRTCESSSKSESTRLESKSESIRPESESIGCESKSTGLEFESEFNGPESKSSGSKSKSESNESQSESGLES